MGRRSTEIRCSITFTRSFHGRHHLSAIQAGHMGHPLQQLRPRPAHQRTAVGSHDQQLQIGHRRPIPNLKSSNFPVEKPIRSQIGSRDLIRAKGRQPPSRSMESGERRTHLAYPQPRSHTSRHASNPRAATTSKIDPSQPAIITSTDWPVGQAAPAPWPTQTDLGRIQRTSNSPPSIQDPTASSHHCPASPIRSQIGSRDQKSSGLPESAASFQCLVPARPATHLQIGRQQLLQFQHLDLGNGSKKWRTASHPICQGVRLHPLQQPSSKISRPAIIPIRSKIQRHQILFATAMSRPKSKTHGPTVKAATFQHTPGSSASFMATADKYAIQLQHKERSC